jgi:hypothetical protein
MTYINYNYLIEKSLLEVVKESLLILQGENSTRIIGDHHFYISFQTHFEGVVISDKLKHRYPNEITIVIQNQFADLVIEEDHFSITLSFDRVPENIVIPFDAITAFADPSVKFGLQFSNLKLEEDSLLNLKRKKSKIVKSNSFYTQSSSQKTVDNKIENSSEEQPKIIDFAAFKNKDKN